jgi:hypothetical protein
VFTAGFWPFAAVRRPGIDVRNRKAVRVLHDKAGVVGFLKRPRWREAAACHHRRVHSAMLPEQPFEGWREQLNQANKLSRTYATLLEALNRHRGKGQQKVTVEHVHVHEGGQAIVGNVTPGGGTAVKSDDQPTQSNLPMHQARRCLARTRRGSPCQSPAMKNGRCRMHGGPSTGAPKGNRNAYKHGRYTQKAIEERRVLRTLLKTFRSSLRVD